MSPQQRKLANLAQQQHAHEQRLSVLQGRQTIADDMDVRREISVVKCMMHKTAVEIDMLHLDAVMKA